MFSIVIAILDTFVLHNCSFNLGFAYCAKYSYDDNWYRCEVTDLVENGVVVLYVDYGNSETIPAEK